MAATTVFSQPADKNSYLQKSKNQRTAGFIILGTGFAVDIIALSTFPKDYGILNTPDQNRQATTSAWIFLAGTATMLASIPFFATAHANKKKALRLAINIQELPLLKSNNLLITNYPALTLKLKL